jgi:serine/threonine protein kinase
MLLPQRLGNREKRRQLQHEVAVLRMLQHPNIVDFKGVWVDPPTLGIVMEWCQMDLYDALTAERDFDMVKKACSKLDNDNGSDGTITSIQLESVMRAIGRSSSDEPASMKEVQELVDEFGMRNLGHGVIDYRVMHNHKFDKFRPLRVLRDIAAGLHYLHTQGVVHRDVKSLNVLLTKDMRAKIADFGDAAMQAASESLGRSCYHTENRHGTAAWMAPEALLIEDSLTSAVDVFSFGVVAWECITFRSPLVHLRVPAGDGNRLVSVALQGREAIQLTKKFVVQMGLRPPQPDGCDLKLWALLGCCWAARAEERPNFAKVIEDLDAIDHAALEARDTFPYLLPAAERLRNPLNANIPIEQ